MKKYFGIMLLAVMAVTVQSCSKEKRTERMLYTKDGEWNVASVTYTRVSMNDTSTVDITVEGTSTNAGTFMFEEDGDGSYSITIDGNVHAQSFNWSVSDEAVSCAKISQSIDFVTGDIEQMVIAFSGTKTDKNKISLSGSETIQWTEGSSGGQTVLTVTMSLEKK